MLPQKDPDRELEQLTARVETLERFTVEMSTSQRLALPELSASASTDDVRTAVRELLDFLRTLRLGA